MQSHAQVRLKCCLNSGTMRYQCVKDHYPELVVWESIVRSLKGAVVDMPWYMGPTTSVFDITPKSNNHIQHSGIF